MGIDWINLFQVQGTAARWWDTFTVGWVVVIMIAIGITELFLSRYVLRLIPEKGLSALPWNFCFKWWYWKKLPPPDESERLPAHILNALSLEERFPGNFETESAGNVKRRKELQLERVTKYYGMERVLHKFNLNCYEGDVTAVIGEAGSGKSTLLNIIAGITPASSGQITVSRQDMGKSRAQAMSFVGYCPSENILYPWLSVEETLGMYCKVAKFLYVNATEFFV